MRKEVVVQFCMYSLCWQTHLRWYTFFTFGASVRTSVPTMAALRNIFNRLNPQCAFNMPDVQEDSNLDSCSSTPPVAVPTLPQLPHPAAVPTLPIFQHILLQPGNENLSPRFVSYAFSSCTSSPILNTSEFESVHWTQANTTASELKEKGRDLIFCTELTI